MTAFLKLYAVSFVAFLALDAVRLGIGARNFSRLPMGDRMLGPVVRERLP